ncbi:MAG: hypothetical protein RIC55_33680 [Pirellulaceae bacterium]
MSRHALVFRLPLAALLLLLAPLSPAWSYEPISGPEVVRYSIRATKPQLDRLRMLALRDGVDVNAIAQLYFGAPQAKYLTIAQAAQLIHDLEYRGQYDITRPHNLRNWSGAAQDRFYGTITWPMFRLFRL